MFISSHIMSNQERNLISPTGEYWLQNSYNTWTDASSPITTDTAPSPKSEDDVTSSVKKGYKHVPHKDRPPVVVARRNARERRRVQAVNSAFSKLRKMVPVVSNRGKRVSKVKTLQTAIDYINGLEALLRQADIYHNIDIVSHSTVEETVHLLNFITLFQSNYRYQTDDFIHILNEFEDDF